MFKNLKNNRKGAGLMQGAVGLIIVVVGLVFLYQSFIAPSQQLEQTTVGIGTVPTTSTTDNVVVKASAFDLAGDTAGGTQVAITTHCVDPADGLVKNAQQATLTSGENTIANYGKGRTLECVATNTTYIGVKKTVPLNADLVPVKLDTYRICDAQDMGIKAKDDDFSTLARVSNNLSNTQRFTVEVAINRTNANCVYPLAMFMIDYDDQINNNFSSFNLGGSPSLQRVSKLGSPTSLSLIKNPYRFESLDNTADQSWIIRGEGEGAVVKGKDALNREIDAILLGESDVTTFLGGSIETDSVGCGLPTGTTDDNDFTFDTEDAIWQLTKDGKKLYLGIENDLDTPTALGKTRLTGVLQTCSTQG